MTRPLALIFCVAFMLSSHAAWARPKVALTRIEGDASGDVRDAVVEALEGGKELSLISGREVNRAVDKLGDLADLTEKDFKKLATELEADAIVLGKLDKVGSAKALKFRLYVHKKMAKGFTVSFKDARSEKFRSLLHDKMLDKIGVSASGDVDDEKSAKKRKAGDDEDETLAARRDKTERRAKKAKKAKGDDDDDARPRKARADDDDDARPRKAKADDDDVRPRKSKVSDDDARPASDDDDARPARRRDSDDDVAPRRSKKRVAVEADGDGDEVEGGIATTVEPPHAANRAAVRLDVGVSVLQRSFKFNSRAFPQKPNGPSLPPVPGARLAAELYPLAFASPRSAAAGLGLGVDYDKTLALNLTATNMMGSQTVAVKQSNYSIGVRYRLAFGKTETSPTLTLGAGYGKRLFSPQTGNLGMTNPTLLGNITRDTPTTEYTVIDPGLTFRLPVTRMVAFSLGGRGMLITNAGPIQNVTSYGRAKVLGFESSASIDIVLGSRFALRFAGEFAQVGFQFLNVGALSNSLDKDSTTLDVGGLADRSISGSATLAVMY